MTDQCSICLDSQPYSECPGRQCQRLDAALIAKDGYRDALLFLVELKRMKLRIEAGEASETECDFYLDHKEDAWKNAVEALKHG